MASRPWDTAPISFRKSISRMLAVDGMTPGDRERANNYDEWKAKTLNLEKYAAATQLNDRYTARPTLAKRWSRSFAVDGGGGRTPAHFSSFLWAGWGKSLPWEARARADRRRRAPQGRRVT